MKKLFRIFLFFVSIVCATKLQASNCVLAGSTIALTRQSEVDSFPINYPGCDTIEGSLVISGNDIVNLNGLIGIKKVIYQLEIKNNPSLVNFNGLNTLKSAEILYVSNNNSLLNFLGLDNLEKVTSRFYVNSNDLLINFNGLNKLDSVVDFYIEGNSRLLNLKGLENLDYVYNFSIRVNNSLTNLNGLTNLKKIASSFYIVSNASLIDFTGINSLNEVYALNIHDNPSIINLNGFQTLSKLDNFYIVSNASLLNFYGFDNIITTHNHCRIQGNSSLINFYGLNNWRIMSTGVLTIADNPSIINLQGLNNLESTGSLEIRGNAKLKNLEGINKLNTMSALQSLNDISITYNPELCNINDLNDSLITNNLLLYIHTNPKLSCCNKISSILDKSRGNFSDIGVYNNAPGCNDTTEIRTITTQNCCSTKYTLLKDNICIGEQVIFNNQILKNSGTYYDTFVSNGNDSIIILELKVFNKSYQIKTLNFCIGQSFTLSNGRTITTTGIYKDTIPNFCDSIIEYRLNFLNN
ncbi:MAG TPA: hypothetical protein PK431_04220, partial [Chitinophagales bacterium]|nr:hypothetical protein [Chitinophagales bacterium]